jgi:hypothetical protein
MVFFGFLMGILRHEKGGLKTGQNGIIIKVVYKNLSKTARALIPGLRLKS